MHKTDHRFPWHFNLCKKIIKAPNFANFASRIPPHITLSLFSLSLGTSRCVFLAIVICQTKPLLHSSTLHPTFSSNNNSTLVLWLDKSSVHCSMLSSSSSASFLRQLSAKKEAWKERRYNSSGGDWGVSFGGCETSVNLMEGFNMMQGNVGRKRVMVVVDDTSHSKHAMLWALTHVANKGDSLTLLHVVPPHRGPESSCSTYLVNYLGSLCKDCKPGVSWLCL